MLRALFLATIGNLAVASSAYVGHPSEVVYDYVIAGAGTAGLLLACILSENPGITVAVLEAGSDARDNYNITIPERRGTIQQTEYDWQFWTVPQPGLVDNGTRGAQPVPRGKTTGGTSAMNWMIHNTDSRKQLDVWEQIFNLTGWDWESIYTAFRQSETQYAPPDSTAEYFEYDPKFHGGHGPIQSTWQRSVLSLFPDYLEPTLLNAGFETPVDRNGGHGTGPGFLPLAIDPHTYTRSYSGSVYTTVQSRPNLHLLSGRQVTGIDWKRTRGGPAVAAGLRYVSLEHGKQRTQHLRAREVILSAGCIQSSQILELSGVGDPGILEPLGIPVAVDLPGVGSLLRDPPMMNYLPISFTLNTTLTNGQYVQNFIHLASAKSMLDANDYEAASAWLDSTDRISGVPDAQLAVFKTLWFGEEPLIEMAWQFSVANVTPYNLLPLSQGSVHINSSDPLDAPAIDPNYNRIIANISGSEVEWDMWFLAKAAQYYETKLATDSPLNSIITASDPPYDLPFDAYFEAVKSRTGSSQHLTGGNPMLPQVAGGVVDIDFRVYGTHNVRVVDGSVFPYQPSAHPMGLTYALAVRAARILQDSRGGGGLTITLQIPPSNDSASATAVFPSSSLPRSTLLPNATSSAM